MAKECLVVLVLLFALELIVFDTTGSHGCPDQDLAKDATETPDLISRPQFVVNLGEVKYIYRDSVSSRAIEMLLWQHWR